MRDYNARVLSMWYELGVGKRFNRFNARDGCDCEHTTLVCPHGHGVGELQADAPSIGGIYCFKK